jgi:CubicO group peptidase (beta-lactamase class C family)
MLSVTIRAVAIAAAALFLGAADRTYAADPPAAVQPPEATDASRQAQRMIDIARSADDDQRTYQAVHELDATGRVTPAIWSQMRPALKQRFQIHRLERATPTEAEYSVFGSAEEIWLRLTVRVEPEPPHRITAFFVTPGPRPSDVPAPPKLQPAALAKAVQERMARLVADDAFSGAVLIAKDGRPILSSAYGLADREHHVANTTDTQFRFGSMGKMFTAVAIMQLNQAGRLDLKAPIGTYLKDYPNQDIAQKVTVENLLTHTGGTGDIFGPDFVAHRLTLRDPKDYVDLYGVRAPLFPPGSRQAYSNYGFMLLGRIVEMASGQSYDDYIAQHIFAPAHMTSTGNQPETIQLAKRSVSYMGAAGQIKSAADTLPWRGTPAGGGYSTVGDLLKFATALASNRLLDEAHWRLLTTGGITGPDGKLIAYDFGSRSPDGRRFLGHNGGAPGMNGELRIFPDDGYVVVVLANRDPPVAQAAANFITDRLP